MKFYKIYTFIVIKYNYISFFCFPVVQCTNNITEVGNATYEVNLKRYQDQLAYHCNIGYEFENNTEEKIVICQANGEWEDAPDDCYSKY